MAQRGVHKPGRKDDATSTRRPDGQKPCSGQNLHRESPTIIHGAHDFVEGPLLLKIGEVLTVFSGLLAVADRFGLLQPARAPERG